jgi:hypothetical protein
MVPLKALPALVAELMEFDRLTKGLLARPALKAAGA